ncbi:L-histidine N(alpha)-methyltransferase [Pleurocapsa sp. PCC 7319]|uniref:L-histidine N(alpha)-methyltransferase n=1 Tax=Pleurocapsa sp. PCC 7319 TaxID=118161 RepID=UPI00034BFF07|nr:L-histidine N(alpha)-methyltransferase [Pleurocapsa sp. PCC 7319]
MSTFSQSPKNNANNLEARLQIDYLLDNKTIEIEDRQEVINGLQRIPKTLPARYFYDSKGSQLFEQICQLPEYYPTRTEAGILEQYAVEIVNQTKAEELIELGSGSSSKTRILLDAYQRLNRILYYTPVDVSDSILKASAYNLLADYENLKIDGKVATYSQALQQLQNSFLGTRMIIFLGSSIGNFDNSECDRLIEQVTAALNPGDYFLLGIDLQKPLEILNAAYNDAQGVTAAFNLNMLQHLNHRFQGNFDLSLFKHQAIYNQIDNQIEMYLISQQTQSVTLEKLNLTIDLAEGEAILTEISRKFNLEQMGSYLGDRHLKLIQSYTDPQQWFGLLLCQKSN